ncbi:glycerophosphodiester phosphodiesterase [Ruania zhangjianzhongii]|uniref:glycerophosphodiester phosphodiesterase n=1 Tax=Ruania zhangjianzhongii TaxID=2603206 RepID=UPI0011CAF1EC|nr:glycerophosphodiester phosphodiesterase [Ruania zhangjianzhongii]
MTLVIAHRGNSSVAPENTLPALAAAGFAGADMIEIDVQVGRDGAGVVIHDDLVDRTTDAAGPVNALDTAEVARLEAGGWLDPAYAGAAVPMFAHVLELLGRFPEVGLLLEFKGTWAPGPAGDLLDALAATAVADRTIVQSFDLETVRTLRELAPTIPCGGLARAGDAETIAICRDLGLVACNPNLRSVIEDPASVQRMHEAGLKTYPWTANEPADWAALVAAGVDGIITDRPDRLRGWLAAQS